MKIVILDGYCLNPGDLDWSGFEAMGPVTAYDRTPVGDIDEIVRRIGNSEIVLTNKTPITRDVLDRCPQVRYVGLLSTGYNVVDTGAAKEKGIPVCNVPGYGTASVAQLTIALLLEICHKVGHHNQAVHQGRWSESVDYCFWDGSLMELAGKTLGIIGYGSIGQAVGRIAGALGMTVIATGPHPWAEGERPAPYVELEEVLRRSDVISLHCPLFPETKGLICKETIAKMKDGAIVLNTGRGPLIVEQDVADALESGKLYGVGVDVAETEPIPKDSPLLTAKNCVITPHIAWAPWEARKRLLDIAVGNVKAFLSGKPVNAVNL